QLRRRVDCRGSERSPRPFDGGRRPDPGRRGVRILRGETRTDGKILSLFEPSTEVIRKGKAAKPNKFGKMVKVQEAKNQIIIDYEVYARRPNDADLLVPAIDTHRTKPGRTPYLVAADVAFYSAKNVAAAKGKGVKRVCIPNRSIK